MPASLAAPAVAAVVSNGTALAIVLAVGVLIAVAVLVRHRRPLTPADAPVRLAGPAAAAPSAPTRPPAAPAAAPEPAAVPGPPQPGQETAQALVGAERRIARPDAAATPDLYAGGAQPAPAVPSPASRPPVSSSPGLVRTRPAGPPRDRP
ncbi:hypothetical protein [Paraconexibacter sp. AEG42_29]